MTTISLPNKDRKFAPYSMGEPIAFPSKAETQSFNRVAYAAAHVVADPLADNNPWLDASIDWDKTIAFREYLWDLGLGVAESMDTAQRGMGLSWDDARELIRRALEPRKARPGVKIACGVGTDHIAPGPDVTVDDVIRAYEEQIEAVEAMNGRLIVMASRALARAAKSPADYARVYGRILKQVKEPVILHWLGEMFDPALAGYWGSGDHMAAMDTCLEIIADKRRQGGRRKNLAALQGKRDRHAPPPARGRAHVYRRRLQLRGIDRGRRGGLFRRAPRHLRCHRAGGIRGPRAPCQERHQGFHGILEPTVPLSRHIFKDPTRFYKTGVVFLAWLNGLQDHFLMIGGQESARSTSRRASRSATASPSSSIMPTRSGCRSRSSRSIR
jgi:hypothetical protein